MHRTTNLELKNVYRSSTCQSVGTTTLYGWYWEWCITGTHSWHSCALIKFNQITIIRQIITPLKFAQVGQEITFLSEQLKGHYSVQRIQRQARMHCEHRNESEDGDFCTRWDFIFFARKTLLHEVMWQKYERVTIQWMLATTEYKVGCHPIYCLQEIWIRVSCKFTCWSDGCKTWSLSVRIKGVRIPWQ
jgi:hypothetical protein